MNDDRHADTDDQHLTTAAELFKLLGTAARLRIVRALLDGPADVTTIAERAALSQPLASQHLRTLRLGGVVEVERTGRTASYAILDQHVVHIVQDALTHAAEGAA